MARSDDLQEFQKDPSKFTELDLRENELGNKEAIALAKCLKDNQSITRLDLGWNQIRSRSNYIG